MQDVKKKLNLHYRGMGKKERKKNHLNLNNSVIFIKMKNSDIHPKDLRTFEEKKA